MWIIIKSNVNPDYEGMHSTNYSEELFRSTPRLKFRLVNDDGLVLFEGYMTEERLLYARPDRTFEPLDRLRDATGVIAMQYIKHGHWHYV